MYLFFSFRKNKLNILIATKVLEEGLDVPNCNFICRMDQIQSYPSFIQSMGRARQKGAKFYALVSDETEAIETDKVQGFIDFSKSLSAALIENCDTPILENEDDISTNDLNRVVPPFQPNGVEGASITAGSATQIVYQYALENLYIALNGLLYLVESLHTDTVRRLTATSYQFCRHWPSGVNIQQNRASSIKFVWCYLQAPLLGSRRFVRSASTLLFIDWKLHMKLINREVVTRTKRWLRKRLFLKFVSVYMKLEFFTRKHSFQSLGLCPVICQISLTIWILIRA